MFRLWLIILVVFSWSDANKKKDLIEQKLKAIWLAQNRSHAGVQNRNLEEYKTPHHTPILQHLLRGDLINSYPVKKEKLVREDVDHKMNRLPMYWFLTNKKEPNEVSVDEDHRKEAALDEEFLQKRLGKNWLVNRKRKPKISIDANVEGGKGLSHKRKVLSIDHSRDIDARDKLKRSRYYWFLKDKKPKTSLDDEGEDRKTLSFGKIKTYKKPTKNLHFVVDDMDRTTGTSKLIIKYEPHAIAIQMAYKRELLPSNENQENNTNEDSSKELLKSKLEQQLDGEVNLIKHYVDQLNKRRAQLWPVLENAEDKSRVQPKEHLLGANEDVTSKILNISETNSPDRFLWFVRNSKNGSQYQLITRIKPSENDSRIRSTWFVRGDDKKPPISRRFSYTSSNLVSPNEIRAALPSVNAELPFFRLPYMIWFRKNHNLKQNDNFNSEKNFNLRKSLDVNTLPTLIVTYKPVAVDVSRTDNSKHKLKTNANDVNEDTDNDDDPVLFLLATELANSRKNTQRLIKVINLIDNYLGVS